MSSDSKIAAGHWQQISQCRVVMRVVVRHDWIDWFVCLNVLVLVIPENCKNLLLFSYFLVVSGKCHPRSQHSWILPLSYLWCPSSSAPSATAFSRSSFGIWKSLPISGRAQTDQSHFIYAAWPQAQSNLCITQTHRCQTGSENPVTSSSLDPTTTGSWNILLTSPSFCEST